MPLLEESQQHTLTDIREMLMDLRRLVAAHGEYLATFGQQTRSEESSDSLDERSPPRRWSPPPSVTQEPMGFKSYSVPRLKPPRFDGKMALDWICKVQEYYNHHYTPLEDRLYLTKYLFDPPATDWFHSYQKADIDGSWEDFLVAVYHRFTPELLEGDSHMVDDVHQSEPIVDAVMLDSSIMDAASTFCSVEDVSLDVCFETHNTTTTTTTDIMIIGNVVGNLDAHLVDIKTGSTVSKPLIENVLGLFFMLRLYHRCKSSGSQTTCSVMGGSSRILFSHYTLMSSDLWWGRCPLHRLLQHSWCHILDKMVS